MKENMLVTYSREFAVDIVKLCNVMISSQKNVLINQLMRSGTSIGANIHEGNYASSRLDFVNKFQIALKECYETEYWLSVFRDAEMISKESYENLYSRCNKLRKLLSTSIKTAKQNIN